MKDIEIRPATKADAEAISALNREIQGIHAKAIARHFKEAGPDTFPPEEIATLISRPQSLFLIAHLASSPAGYVHAEIIRRPETSIQYAYDMIYIHSIGVSAAHRRLGVGTRLLDRVEEIAKSLGIASIALDVWSFNREARAFFSKAGLHAVHERLSKQL